MPYISAENLKAFAGEKIRVNYQRHFALAAGVLYFDEWLLYRESSSIARVLLSLKKKE